MNYKEYQSARNLTWEILIQENIRELPIDIVSLCRKLGIAVKYSVPTEGNDGECTVVDGVPYILLRKDVSTARKRFTCAHELGHILLGHAGKYRLVSREPAPTDNPIEQAANVFASRLLAPACVLWGCNARTAEEIARLCDISQTAAEFRVQRMQELYRRNRFLSSPLERQVYEQFKEFIKSNRLGQGVEKRR